MDAYDQIVNAVVAIKEDENLRRAFIKILSIGSYTQQVRVEKIRAEVEPMNPPEEVTNMLTLLKNDKLAHLVLNALQEG